MAFLIPASSGGAVAQARRGGASACAAVHGKNVLVVGGTGRVGRQIVDQLLKDEARVVALVRDQDKAREAGLVESEWQGRLKLLTGSFGSDAIDALRTEAAAVDAVVWTAGGSRETPPAIVDNQAVAELASILSSRMAEQRKVVLDAGSKLEAQIINDGVMGGLSEGSVTWHEQDGDSYFAFRGITRTEKNGGFSSVKFKVDGDGVDLSQMDGLCLEVRGDCSRFKVALKNDNDQRFSFQAAFDVPEGNGANGWKLVRIPFEAMVPVDQGRILHGEGSALYSVTLDRSRIRSIAFLRSKLDEGSVNVDFEPGPFNLEVRSVAAYAATTPKFVLVSSAGVTRLLWSDEQKIKYKSSYDIPIVGLNPGNVLLEKLQGEDAVRTSGIPYSIVRFTGLPEKKSSAQAILSQGDTAVGNISLGDAATVVTAVLSSTAATFKTFEARTSNEGPALDENALSGDFARLRFDVNTLSSTSRVPESLQAEAR